MKRGGTSIGYNGIESTFRAAMFSRGTDLCFLEIIYNSRSSSKSVVIPDVQPRELSISLIRCGCQKFYMDMTTRSVHTHIIKYQSKINHRTSDAPLVGQYMEQAILKMILDIVS